MSDKKNKLNQSLFDFKVNVDNDALWSSLEEHIPQSKKRRALPIWWTFPIAIVVAISTYSITSTLESNKLPIKVETQFVSNTEEIGNPDQPTNINTSVPLDEIESSTDTNSTNKITISNESIESTTINSSLFKDLTSYSSQLTHHVPQDQLGTFQQKAISVNTLEGLSDKVTDIAIVGVIKGSDNGIELDNFDYIQKRDAVQKVPIIGKQMLSIPILTTLTEEYVIEDRVLPLNKSIISRVWIRPNIGVGSTKVQNTTLSSDQNYLKYLNQVQSTLPSLSASIQIGLDLDRKWSVYSGINYQRLANRITIDFQKQSTESTSATVTTVINPDGSTQELTGQIETTTQNNYSANWHTYNHIISMPLGVEYTLINIDRINLNLMLGANIRILDFQSGAVLNTNQELSKFGYDDSPYKVGLFSPFGGISLSYPISKRSELGMQCAYNHMTSTYMQDQLVIEENTSSIITSIDFKYSF